MENNEIVRTTELFSTHNLFTKSELRQSVKSLLEDIAEGDKAALPVYIQLKRFEYLVEHALKEIKPAAITEAERYNPKERTLEGAGFALRDGGATYDFSECELWNEVKANIEREEMILKIFKEQLKQIEKCAIEQVVYPDTGEIFPSPRRINNTNNQIITVTIPN